MQIKCFRIPASDARGRPSAGARRGVRLARGRGVDRRPNRIGRLRRDQRLRAAFGQRRAHGLEDIDVDLPVCGRGRIALDRERAPAAVAERDVVDLRQPGLVGLGRQGPGQPLVRAGDLGRRQVFQRLPVQRVARMPWLGEHTDAVLHAELGLEDDTLAALRADGVIV